jgi:hypothetical protein
MIGSIYLSLFIIRLTHMRELGARERRVERVLLIYNKNINDCRAAPYVF